MLLCKCLKHLSRLFCCQQEVPKLSGQNFLRDNQITWQSALRCLKLDPCFRSIRLEQRGINVDAVFILMFRVKGIISVSSFSSYVYTSYEPVLYCLLQDQFDSDITSSFNRLSWFHSEQLYTLSKLYAVNMWPHMMFNFWILKQDLYIYMMIYIRASEKHYKRF